MFRPALRLAALTALAVSLSAVAQQALAAPGRPGSPALVVPTDYPTIQSAIDASRRGGTVLVLPGTYTEQVAITKDLTLVGAGMDVTIIRAPAALEPGPLGSPAILEVWAGARAAVSGLTVRGPGAAACGQAGVLRWGVRVDPGARLDFSYGAVRDIQNTPMAVCPRSGTAIAAGSFVPDSPPSVLNVDHSEVTGYQSLGIIVLGAGSTASISQNVVTGPGHPGGVPTTGIELVAGAVGTIVHNTVSGNVCPDGMPDICGPDFFTQIQEAGISAGGNGPGTVISHNLLVGNQLGLFLSESDEIAHNVMRDNEYFGLALVGVDTAAFTIEGAAIIGGGGRLSRTAVISDMDAVAKMAA